LTDKAKAPAATTSSPRPPLRLPRRPKRDSLARIALWQFLSFVILVLVLWLNEVVDLAALWFGTPPSPPDLFRACALTAAVVVVAIVTVGYTHEQQKRVIRGLLTVCSYCHKVRVQQETWTQMEEYVTEHSLALITHGVCPECFERLRKELDSLDGK
jgi:hypothetical protein